MFIDQREYKEEWYDGIFNLGTFNDAFFEKVIAVYYYASSGMGGPGVLRLLTDNNVQYEIGMDMMEGDPFFGKPEERGFEGTHVGANVPMLERTGVDAEDEKFRKKFRGELEGWTYRRDKLGMGVYLVRNDYLEIDSSEGISRSMDSEDETYKVILWPFGRIGRFFMRNGKTPKTYLYEGTRDYRIYPQERMA